MVSDPDRKYVGTEAWSALEVIKDGDITTKADIFAFGMLIYEMLSLHSPHVDKLVCDDSDDDTDESLDEEAFREALGTRPPLPDSFDFDASYRVVLEIFFAATNEDASKRPSAKEILEMLANKKSDDDNDESVVCVNMVKGDNLSETIDIDTSHDDSSSVICIDDSVSETTPSAS